MATPRLEHRGAADQVRGSRKHLLDHIETVGAESPLALLLASERIATQPGEQCPAGYRDPREKQLRTYLRGQSFAGFDARKFDRWWVNFKSPTWDLLWRCSIGSRPGLLMVEAKAHVGELSAKGKPIEKDATPRSRANHARIATCIDEECASLHAQLGEPIDLSIDRRYQLSNRIASAWKLAECGLSVVLLYLGFVGDTYFQDFFTDDDHWQTSMRSHIGEALPSDFVGRTIEHESRGSFLMLSRSLPVVEVSR